MNDTYLSSGQLFKSTIRVPKEHSVFLYFIIEALEGICFFSTLDFEKGQTYRDIEFSGSIECYEDFQNILKKLAQEIPLTILEN